MKVQFLQDPRGQWYWHTVSANGNITAQGTGYNTRYGAKRAWARHVWMIKMSF